MVGEGERENVCLVEGVLKRTMGQLRRWVVRSLGEDEIAFTVHEAPPDWKGFSANCRNCFHSHNRCLPQAEVGLLPCS